jgi:hypothetical protein
MDEFSTQRPLVDDNGDAERGAVGRGSESSPPIESASCYPHLFKNAEEEEFFRMLPVLQPPSPPSRVDFSQFGLASDSSVDAKEITGAHEALKWGEYQAPVAPQAAENRGLAGGEASRKSDTEDAHD